LSEETKMKRHSRWALALVLGGAAVGIAQEGVVEADQNADQNNVSGEQRVSSAAYRDGLYLGKLAAERGDSAHIATGRWARESDRTLFASGYQEAYTEIAARTRNVFAGQAVAAYRDGLYLGKFDSEHGDAAHVAAGRWSNASHRTAFADGYSQSYKNGDAARTAQNKLRLAQLVR
jgi:uncharacterized protein with FMN-binding domain